MKKQCFLSKHEDNKFLMVVSWLDEKAACKGKMVELLENGKSLGFWKVLTVYEPPLTNEYLQMKQSADKDFKRKTDY